MLSKGIAYWTFAHKPKVNDEYNINRYELTLHVSKEEAEKIHKTGVDVKATTPDFNIGFEGGYVVFKKNAINRKGEKMKPVPVVDRGKNPITDDIGNGSEVVVSWTPYEWNVAGKKGVKPLLNAIQVLNLVPYTGSGVSEFENFDDTVTEF